MFGYVRVNKPELRVREYEFYRASYCGLCRSMGKCTGQCSRMTLSYDFAFLALLRIALTKDTTEFDSKRCIAHPLKKRSYMKRNPTLEYCAGAAALLNYHKVRDDLSDERGIKRLRAVALIPFMSYSRKRAIKKLKLSELDGRISAGLSKLAEIEAARPASTPGRVSNRAVKWSMLPAPPEAMTGTETMSQTALSISRSKPPLTPSVSMELTTISPAP